VFRSSPLLGWRIGTLPFVTEQEGVSSEGPNRLRFPLPLLLLRALARAFSFTVPQPDSVRGMCHFTLVSPTSCLTAFFFVTALRSHLPVRSYDKTVSLRPMCRRASYRVLPPDGPSSFLLVRTESNPPIIYVYFFHSESFRGRRLSSPSSCCACSCFPQLGKEFLFLNPSL